MSCVCQVNFLIFGNPFRPRLFEKMVSLVIKSVNSTGNYSQINLTHFFARQQQHRKIIYSNYSESNTMNSMNNFHGFE